MCKDTDQNDAEGIPNIMDLSIVDIRNEDHDDSKGCFAGIGISGYQIAKRLSEEYFHISKSVLSRTTLNFIHESGEAQNVLNQRLSHLQNKTIVIISGSISDPHFHSLRKIALEEKYMYLWTILDAPNDNSVGNSFLILQPQMNESITIITHGNNYVEQSVILVQTLVHCLSEPGAIKVDITDLMKMFSKRWTKNINVDTNIQTYAEDIQRLILQNKELLLISSIAVLSIFIGSWNFVILENIRALLDESMCEDPNIFFAFHVIEEFDSRIYVDIIFERVNHRIR